jgi:hypothetical protein
MKQDAIDDLWDVLQEHPDDLSELDGWCENLEAFWNVELSMYDDSGETKTSQEPILLEERLIQVSARLRSLLIHALQGLPIRDAVEMNGESQDDLLNKVIAEQHEKALQQQPSLELTAVFRVCKNLLRWFLQIYLTVIDSSVKSDPIPEWKSLKMLQLYLVVIEKNCTTDQVLAQHASQLLFYASYNPISGSDSGLQNSYQHLLEQDSILSCLLECLMHSSADISLTLSIVRNVHNILVSFPKGADYAAQASIETLPTDSSSWLPTEGPVTFKMALPLIALWALQQEPLFPGSEGDKRAELVVEIQRTCYVLRMGSDLKESRDGPLSIMILSLLRLDPTQQSCDDCRRAAIPLLMDTSGDIADYLFAQGVITPLLSILEAQVSCVLDKQLVNESAAAILTPILVVLHKFCSSSSEIRQGTKSFIFPPELEEDFQERLRQEVENHGTVRSMKPLLNAPADSLRGKLIQLLTWPQSHIKRFTGELIWILCESDPQDFVARVGMGNAVMILGARGLVQIPGQS